MKGFVGFDWDAGNRAKCARHGVSIVEIEGLFEGNPALASDIEHSRAEVRVRAVGQTAAGRFVFVVFTVRTKLGKRLIRPISARYMHRKEIRDYEETGP
jgi:uncharacterized DUF497 family protein